MKVSLATTDHGGDVLTHDVPLKEIPGLLVTKLHVSTGFMTFQCDDHDHDHHDHDIDEDRDVAVVQLRMLDGEEGTIVMAASSAMRLAADLMEWLNELHEAGRCECGDHEGEN